MLDYLVRRLVLVVLLIGLVLTPACQFRHTLTPLPEPTDADGCPIKIGIIDHPTPADENRLPGPGYEMALDEINAAGGVGGCLLTLKARDDQGDAGLAQAAAQELFDAEQVVMVLGASSSNSTLPAALEADRRQAPLIVPIGQSALITEMDYKWVFRLPATSENLVRTGLEWLYSVADPNLLPTLGILYEADLSGLGVATAFLDETEKRGWSVVAYEKFNADASDFGPLLTRVRQANPGVIFISVEDAGVAARLLKQFEAAELNPMAIVGITGGFGEPDFLKQAGKHAEYALVVTQWTRSIAWEDAQGQTAEAFARAFEKRYNAPPDYRNVQRYAALKVAQAALAEALPQGRANLAQNIRQALLDLRLDQSIYGPISFDRYGQNSHPGLVVQVINGQHVPVFPPAYTAESAIFPAPPWSKR